MFFPAYCGSIHGRKIRIHPLSHDLTFQNNDDPMLPRIIKQFLRFLDLLSFFLVANAVLLKTSKQEQEKRHVNTPVMMETCGMNI